MKTKRNILLLLLAVMVAATVGAFSLAIWEPERAVNINPADIENSTLIIGTHLIHLSALTNPLYDIAYTSAGESGQDKIYYKSELAGGTWFDITTASVLTDITTGGTPVGEDVIASLLLTHHTKSDGITYDLRTNQSISVFDIRDPYDLESMEELLPLKMQFDLTMEMQSESAYGQVKIGLMEAFFATEVTNGTTEQYDRALSALQTYYNVLSQNDGGAAEMEVVQSVMDAVDAARRAEVMNIIDGALKELAQRLNEIVDGEADVIEINEDGEEEVVDTVEIVGGPSDPDLMAAVNDSIANISDAYITQSGKMLDEGLTVMSSARYDACNDLISDAEAPNHSACDEDVAKIIALDNILNSVVAAKQSELDLLDSPLIPTATSRFTGHLYSGTNAEYNAAVAANAANALKNGIIKQNKSQLTVYRSELEFFIDAKCLRLGNDEAIRFVDERLSLTVGFHSRVPSDDFSASAAESIDEHIEFLTNLKRKLELANGGSETDKLVVEKSALQTELLSALDNNDLALAKEIEGKIAEIDEQIDALEQAAIDEATELQGRIDDLENMLAQAQASGDTDGAASLSQELAQAKADLSGVLKSMSEGSVGALVAELRNECMDLISNGEDSDAEGDLMSNMDALGALLDDNFNVVFPVLEELHDAMEKKRDLTGDSSFDEAIAAIEDMILNNMAAYNAAMMADMSDVDFDGIADEFFSGGTPLFDAGLLGTTGDGSGLSEDERAIVYILALKMFAEQTGDTRAEQLMRARTQRQSELGNLLVYIAIKDTATRYLPAPSIAKYLNMRYVWNQNGNEGTLARGGTYYYYTVYSTAVLTGKNKEDVSYMSTPARYLRAVHLPEEYTYETFALWPVYIAGTDYGVLVSQPLEELAAELFAMFLR